MVLRVFGLQPWIWAAACQVQCPDLVANDLIDSPPTIDADVIESRKNVIAGNGTATMCRDEDRVNGLFQR